ncbi:MAG: hypothetical protein DI534_03080 [Leifsonia xyli]|nr:MAG: hypothetical protein DI534_03080 [Leifsonia xyli]
MPDLELVNLLREHLAALRALPAEVEPYRAAGDAELIAASSTLTELIRALDGHRALVAGEIARRSAPEFGYRGLAQREGHRTAEEFLRARTGVTTRDAKNALRAGAALHDAVELPDARTGELVRPVAPWMRPIADAVAGGLFGAEHIASVRRGLGDPGEGVDAESLLGAAETLCREVAQADGTVPDADRLYRRARALRDELDAEGVADRERQRFARRSFTLVPQPDGMTRISWLLDPESAGYVANLYDRITSPKRGGPRFVDAAERDAAEAIELDPRTPAQLASDVFLDLLRAGATADATQLLGGDGAAVQLVIVDDQLERPAGHGWIVGAADPISRETVERHICTDGRQSIRVTPAGDPLDVGRTRRLHSRKQRIALAIRDGGCRFGDCARGPGMVEAHHIDHWTRDRGGTSVERGILLCRYHHLRIHNEGWQIRVSGVGRFELIPPPTVDVHQTPIPMPSKTPIARDLERRRAG